MKHKSTFGKGRTRIKLLLRKGCYNKYQRLQERLYLVSGIIYLDKS